MTTPRTDGERWTREQLELLLERRFAPRAVGAFLAESQRRANAVRAERPELARQARAWMAAGAAAHVARAAGAVKRSGRGRTAASRHPGELGWELAWWAAVALMLDWHLGMVETPDGEPRPLGPADAMTLTRAWLVPRAARDPTPAVCLAAGLTDVLDGRLARATAPTRAGRDLEGLVDFCFSIAALHGLRHSDRIGTGAVAAESARTTAGFAYALTAYFGGAERPEDALIHAARATTVVRVAGIVAAAADRKRLGEALLLAGSLVSLAAASRASSRARAASP